MLAGIAAAMAMLPEEFPVILTVFLALGAWRMARSHVLTRRPAVIETLGSATVVCVDKTGTLTLNEMTVTALVVDGQMLRLGDEPLPEDMHLLVEYAVLASPIDPFDPMDRAFVEMGQRTLAGTEHLHRDWQLVREYPLSESLLALSHVWRSPDGGRFVIAAKGAPEAIADLCHLDPQSRGAMLRDVETATADGMRVLAVARAMFAGDALLPAEQHDFDFAYLGLVCLRDPVRPGVADAVAECAGAGVRTVMITGDYPGTALAVARDIGLDHDGGCVTGPQVQAMDDATLALRVREVSVFARMVPEQKLRLVRALQVAFLELIIDPACAVVFEAEEPDPRNMAQPPRGLGETLVNRRLLATALLQGVSVLVAVLAVYLWAVWSGRPDDVVRSITFIALVLGNLSLILVNRSSRLTVAQALRRRRNPTVKWVVGGALAMLVALLAVPWLRELFSLGAVTVIDVAVAALAALASVAWFELVKLRRRSGDLV